MQKAHWYYLNGNSLSFILRIIFHKFSKKNVSYGDALKIIKRSNKYWTIYFLEQFSYKAYSI